MENKTAVQELFSMLEQDQPELFNVHTAKGKEFVNKYHHILEIERNQAHEYAEFAIRCDRKEMKILNFDGFIKLKSE